MVAVLATAPSDLERLVSLTNAAGACEVIAIPLESVAPIPEAASIWILHSGEAGPNDRLATRLRERPDHVALLVIGEDPARRTSPTLWLPAVPEPGFLGAILGGLRRKPSSAAPTWRRKSDMILGNSPMIRQLLHTLDQLAPAQTPVIITGESGVGKELVAQALHFCGPRSGAPFVAINCAAIPENLFEAELFGYERGAFTGATQAHLGAFEAAERGTLFLDEIGEMPLPMQSKLLRVIETSEVRRLGSTDARKVDFRLVTATNRTLETEIRAGRFREDLYYRIQVYPVHVAPLRERPEDIPPIVTHQLAVIAERDHRASMRLTPSALKKLMMHSWPGNVRELVNLLERAALVAECNVIDAAHIVLSDLSPSSTQSMPSLVPYRDAKARFELDYYSCLMRVASGNVSLAAKLGQKTRKEVYDAMKRLGLDATAYRTGDDLAG